MSVTHLDNTMNSEKFSPNGKHATRETSVDIEPSQSNGRSQLQRRDSKRGIKGSTLSCHNLTYTVEIAGKGCCKKIPKVILCGVNGIFKPGMNAILGPTGGGKTSMLDVLAGRKNPAGVEGILLVDGHKVPKNFKCMTGYVVQDDVVMGTLTVRENLMFSANLRLPRTFTPIEKDERVEDTIQELGLSKCADSKIGTEFIRGVSGGERKRTNIGMELIISPSVLFLDEPTTGLDASTSNAVMILLRRLSIRGRTIIFSIHQPRYSIFKCFDRLMLLAAGRTVYHGPSDEALSYLSAIGYECEAHNNPPDFFLDVINGDSSAVKNMESHMEKEPIANYENDEPVSQAKRNGDHFEIAIPEEKSLAETLAEKYGQSPQFAVVHQEITQILAKHTQDTANGTEVKFEQGEYVSSFGTQLKYVSKRTLMNLLRNPQSSVMQCMVTVVLAVVVGLIFLQLGDDISSGVQNRIGLMFFVIVNQMFGNLSAVELFIKERVIFLHESSSGFYRTSAYFVAKITCDVIPMRIVPVSLFAVITYFMVGLQVNAGKFFIYLFILFLTTMCASGIGFVISASVRVFAIANLLISLCYVIMMVFGGLLVNVGKMGDWLSWLQYFSIVRYSLNAMSINELKGKAFYTYNNSMRLDSTENYAVGIEYLDLQKIKHLTDWDLWQNMFALAVIAIGMMTLTYIQLRRLVTYK